MFFFRVARETTNHFYENMARFKTSSKQNQAIENFIRNLSDIEVDEENNQESSDDGKSGFDSIFHFI